MKTKTETQIAQENIKKYHQIKDGKYYIERDMDIYYEKIKCQTHKATCQRFLGFLQQKEKFIKLNDESKGSPCCKYNTEGDEIYCSEHQILIDIQNKITDLKQAIKLYDEAVI